MNESTERTSLTTLIDEVRQLRAEVRWCKNAIMLFPSYLLTPRIIVDPPKGEDTTTKIMGTVSGDNDILISEEIKE